MVKEPTLIIMAAGMGSRFGGLKQITPISGNDEIILDFSLYDAMMAGFKKAIIIIKEENESDFRKMLDNRAGKYLDIEYVYQKIDDIPKGFAVPEGRKKPWGTGHAVLAARKLIDGPFAVINADDYYGPTAFQEIYSFLENAEDKDKYDYCMVGFSVENTMTENGSVSRGICEVNEKNELTSITEHTGILWKNEKIISIGSDETETELQRGTTVSMNFWGFTESFIKESEAKFPSFLERTIRENPEKGEYFLPGIVDELIKSGKAGVKVLKSPDFWHGVTYKEDTEEVVNAIQSMKDNGLYPERLWK